MGSGGSVGIRAAGAGAASVTEWRHLSNRGRCSFRAGVAAEDTRGAHEPLPPAVRPPTGSADPPECSSAAAGRRRAADLQTAAPASRPRAPGVAGGRRPLCSGGSAGPFSRAGPTLGTSRAASGRTPIWNSFFTPFHVKLAIVK